MARELAHMFAPQISHFHRSQAQNYSLSVIPSVRVQRSYGDVHMTYTNHMGHETIDVRIPREILERVQRGQRTPWDWVIIEYVVPLGSPALSLSMRARRTIPQPTAPVSPRDGWSYDNGGNGLNHDGRDPPIVTYPAGDVEPLYTINQPDSGDVVSSLGIDLRPFNGNPVTADLAGFLGIGPTQVVAGWTAGSASSVLDSTTSLGTATLTIGLTAESTFWTPDAAAILAMFPYQGSAQIFADSNWGATMSVAVENAPTSNAAMIAAPSVTIHNPGYGSGPAQSHNIIGQGTAYHNVQVHPQSGFVTRMQSTHFQMNRVSSVHIGGGVFEDTFEISLLNQTDTRSVVEYYGSEMLPVTVDGSVRYFGGFGAPPWVSARVTADIPPEDYNRWGVLQNGEPILLDTVLLREGVPVSGDGSQVYELIGTVTVDPMTYSAGFEVA